jgi:hypothetical protein
VELTGRFEESALGHIPIVAPQSLRVLKEIIVCGRQRQAQKKRLTLQREPAPPNAAGPLQGL